MKNLVIVVTTIIEEAIVEAPEECSPEEFRKLAILAPAHERSRSTQYSSHGRIAYDAGALNAEERK